MSGGVDDFVLDADLIAILCSVALLFLFMLYMLEGPTSYDESAPPTRRPAPKIEGEAKDGNASTDGQRVSRRVTPPYKPGHVYQIVVLGDIGRSPRMQYHAISIAKHGGSVFLFGNAESELHPDITSNPLIEVVPLAAAPALLRIRTKALFPIIAPLKAIWQALQLCYALSYRSPPAKWMLVQNPPSIPTLFIAKLVCLIRNTKLVIDWHNFGYSLLALKLGPRHPLVTLSTLYEHVLARRAHEHFTVTHAMSRFLEKKCNIKPLTLHDRPASLYRPITQDQRAAFLTRLEHTAPYAKDLTSDAATRTKLLVSPTSWTADEDFSLLLAALSAYSARATSDTKLPPILALITGKGPLKSHYESQITALTAAGKLANVTIKTAWLTPEDYALLLASADLGVSLHTSSSGVDLPMKVVDMFGAGLPVVGWSKFEAWGELVVEGVNGMGFGSAGELCGLLETLLVDGKGVYARLKRGAVEESRNRWEGEWDRVAGRLFGLL